MNQAAVVDSGLLKGLSGERRWGRLSLSLRFSLAASIVVLIGMGVIGSWVSARIEDGVIKAASVAAQAYIEEFVAPHLQELAAGTDISESHKAALDEVLSPHATSKPILAFRIWQGRKVVYSNRRDIIGKVFPETEALAAAWKGTVVGEFDHTSEEHLSGTVPSHTPLLEIYAPVRDREDASRIIALAETYEVAADLKHELSTAQFQSWLVVGAVTLAIMGSLFGIVHNGSRTIERQRRSLEERISELSRLLAENSELRRRVNQANERMADTNERLLRRIGADLHDGPVQLLGLSLLKLGDLCEAIEESNPQILANSDATDIMRAALSEAIQEIRNLSAGLSPPDIEKLSLKDTLQLAARKHKQRTGTEVRCELDIENVDVPFSLKTCLYRFAQEGLNNAFQHAGGAGQVVTARRRAGELEVRIADAGPGLAAGPGFSRGGGQGLGGLRDRIESLGGTFEIHSEIGKGTTLVARFGTVE
jgi:signal transduction histidine kinase